MARVTATTIYLAKSFAEAQGLVVDEAFVQRLDQHLRQLKDDYEQARQVQLDEHTDEFWFSNDPWHETETVCARDGTIRRVLGALGPLVAERTAAIHTGVACALDHYADNVDRIVTLFGDCMQKAVPVRFIGAGRALLAASLAANRLFHGGALAYCLHDKTPLPNSRLGGVLVAASASGQTPEVLGSMARVQAIDARRRGRGLDELITVGIAHHQASTFRELTSPGYFIGLAPQACRLRALGDIEEFIIAELLDALVVAAGQERFINFRRGHEDLGPTGPWHQQQR